MADTLYLSLWYPNLRVAALPDKLVAVLSAFAAHGGEAGVYAATIWPVGWSESPIFQQIWGRSGPNGGEAGVYAATIWPVGWSESPIFQQIWGRSGPNAAKGADPRVAVEAALELLHDDYAYEFQIGWNLWELESGGELEDRWVRQARFVRVTGFGPLFDEGAYEQDGHIRVDFGDDTPFLEEDVTLDSIAARHIEENVRQLVALTTAIEKDSGATARLLWSELGESLAQRLAARLGTGN